MKDNLSPSIFIMLSAPSGKLNLWGEFYRLMLRKVCMSEFENLVPFFFLGGTSVDNSGTTTTTPSPAFRSCLSNCPTINNYNPVCGSNGVTYDNQYKLECARRCGLRKCFYFLYCYQIIIHFTGFNCRGCKVCGGASFYWKCKF